MVSLPDGQAEQQQRVPFEPLVVVNPRIAPLSDAGARFFEGCLSVPGYQALVERYLSVEVEGLTPEGLPIKLAANGWKARILQHECDHLAGVLVRRST
jgi:peptide deformylase